MFGATNTYIGLGLSGKTGYGRMERVSKQSRNGRCLSNTGKNIIFFINGRFDGNMPAISVIV
ncbi:hypothetical protein FACS1894182_11030 [Bacteroidia bacterium]|nr:hypothetical protein FACS1894182_11030 [Bacteroidia bacterium]